MLKKFKEELLFFPIMMIVIELFRHFLISFYPETAVFDRGSELETFLLSMWKTTWITCGVWLLLRVVFPPAHAYLTKFYYDGFNRIDDAEKRSISLKFFFCFFFGLVLLMSGRAGNENTVRTKLVDTLNAQLHVREATGHNDGVDVEKYLSFVGQTKGASWCAAFTSFNLNAVGVTAPPNPKSAWSPAFAKRNIIWSQALQKQHKVKVPPQPGDCFTLYFEHLKRVGHVGFIIGENAQYYITIEGNTGTTGSREGSGVHKYKRDKRKIYAITNYITPYLNEKNTTAFNTDSVKCFVLLPMATYTKYGNQHRENGDSCYQERFDSTEGYNVSLQSGFRNDTSGYRSSDQYAGNSYRNSPDTVKAFYNKRESHRGLLVQGTRRESKASGTIHNRTDSYRERQTERQGCYRNKRGSVYT